MYNERRQSRKCFERYRCDGRKKSYQINFGDITGADGVTVTYDKKYIGLGETLSPTITRGYNLTDLNIGETSLTESDGKFIFKVPEGSTAATFTIDATVELDVLTLDASNNYTAVISSGNTKTIQVKASSDNVIETIWFAKAESGDATIKANFDGGTYKGLEVVKGYVDIPAADNPTINNLIVSPKNADSDYAGVSVSGSNDVDNLTINGVMLQSSFYEYSDSGASLGADGKSYTYTRPAFKFKGNGGDDNVTFDNIKINGGILHSFGYGNGNKLFTENGKVSGTGSNLIVANIEGANHTISVDGVTLDNTNYNSQIGNWNSANETISVNDVSMSGGMLGVKGLGTTIDADIFVGDVTFDKGKLSIAEGGNYSVEGYSVMLNFPSENKTFTLNGHTYTANEHGLTYDDNGVTMFDADEFNYNNATVEDVLGTSASTNWIPISVVENKTAVLPATLAREVYFIDDVTYEKYAKLEVTGDTEKNYRVVNVDGNENVYNVTFDISNFGKEISFEVVEWLGDNFKYKNLSDAKIKISTATFTVNGVTYTTDEILGVIATADSSKIYGTGDNDGVTETLKVTIDDGKNLTADDKSTLHGGKFILGNNVTVTIDGNKTVKLTSAESVNLTYENDIIKDFTIDNGTLEVIGTDNDDNINVDGKINIDSGNGADKITVAGGATVKADSDDTVTVTKNNSAVIEFNEKSATITALDVDSKLTFEESGLVIAENWKGNVDGNITLSLPAGTYLHCR